MPISIATRLRNAGTTALALCLAYGLAFYWTLDKPFWAGFTVLMISLPSIGQSMQKILLRILGTLIGAMVGLGLFAAFQDNRASLLLGVSVYISSMVWAMLGNKKYGYGFFTSGLVAMIIIIMAAQNPYNAFDLALYRTQETLLGIGVYTLVELLCFPQSAGHTLFASLHALVAQHQRLFVVDTEPTKQDKIAAMYHQYLALKAAQDAVDVLLPAVELENHTVYSQRKYWNCIVQCSRQLAEAQRKWAALLIALRAAPHASPFINMQACTERLQQAFATMGDLPAPLDGQADAQQSTTELISDPQQVATLSSVERHLVSTLQGLFLTQTELCASLHNLLRFTLHGGTAPLADMQHLDAQRPEPRPWLDPVQIEGTLKVFVMFWIIALVWIWWSPPGNDTTTFMELTMVLGLSVIMSGANNPAPAILYFGGGIGLSAVLYLGVYPNMTHSLAFLGVTFAVAVVMLFVLYRPEHTFAKISITIPWLALGNYSNTMHYDPQAFFNGALTLIFGIVLLCGIFYILFSRNNELLFVAIYRNFVDSVLATLHFMMTHATHNKLIMLYIFVRIQVLHVRALRMAHITQYVRNDFIPQDARSIMVTEVMDITKYVHELRAEMLHSNQAAILQKVLDASREHGAASVHPDTITAHLEQNKSLLESQLHCISAYMHDPHAPDAVLREQVPKLYANVISALESSLNVLRAADVQKFAVGTFSF